MILDPQLGFMVVLLLALAAIAWWRGGAELVQSGLGEGVSLLVRFGLLIAVSFLAAGIAQALVPQEWVRTALGREAGIRGLLTATVAGMLTPAGPFVSMPIAAVMLKSGAAPSAVMAFLTSWSLLAVHRLVAWETPILGARFALLRYAVSLGVPLLVGLMTRAVTRGG